MEYIVIVRFDLSKPFAHWASCFDEHEPARIELGITTLFRYAVIGQQAAIYAVRTAQPRLVHDVIYAPSLRKEIEASGFIVGSEQITLCESE
ncbi:DUF3764 family protein [Acetobacter senegalensis]|uniref:DUF3764 family protein n=1 Tax=Acetobacter senegalensis TaxID=446692 RepID=UPI001EDB004C|nr:DUF3764 family protein [Acetobacter senegalensis]MCG4262435.1 DUF3764 family protein [Acetobacter senegalensis]